MKTRLNLTTEEKLPASMKSYVQSRDTGISQVVESYFKKITQVSAKKSIVDHIKKRGKLKINFDVNADLVELYHKETGAIHGF